MIRETIRLLGELANELDNKGLYAEASALDACMVKLANGGSPQYNNQATQLVKIANELDRAGRYADADIITESLRFAVAAQAPGQANIQAVQNWANARAKAGFFSQLSPSLQKMVSGGEITQQQMAVILQQAKNQAGTQKPTQSQQVTTIQPQQQQTQRIAPNDAEVQQDMTQLGFSPEWQKTTNQQIKYGNDLLDASRNLWYCSVLFERYSD